MKPRPRPLTDDEMEERARRNFFDDQERVSPAFSHDPDAGPLEQPDPRKDDVDGPLETWALRGPHEFKWNYYDAESEDVAGSSPRPGPPSPERKKLVSDGAWKYRPGGEWTAGARERYREQKREAQRKEYAREKGGKVRRYRVGLDRPSEEELKKEAAARSRKRYHKNAAGPVRGRQDLSTMTQEEKIAHRREQKRLSQQKAREKTKAEEPAKSVTRTNPNYGRF